MPAVPRYLLLPAPAANRVYAEAAASMVRAELTVLSRGALAGRVGPVETATVAGVEYLAFEADALTERDLGFLGLASAFYALFEADGELLRPVALGHPGPHGGVGVHALAGRGAGEQLGEDLHVLEPGHQLLDQAVGGFLAHRHGDRDRRRPHPLPRHAHGARPGGGPRS